MNRILRGIAAFSCTVAAASGTSSFAYGQNDPDYTSAVASGWSCGSSSMAPLPDDSVLFPVTNSTVSGPRYGIAKVRADGVYDPSWQGGIAPISDSAGGATLPVLPLPGGGVIVPGPRLQRLLKDGSIDTTYGDRGLSEPVGTLVSAALQADGSVVVAQRAQIGMGISHDVVFHRILPNGLHDPAFGDHGTQGAGDGTIYAWSVKDDGSVEVGYSQFDSLTGRRIVPVLRRFPVDFTDADRPQGRVMPRAGVASWVAPNVLVDGAGGAVFAAMAQTGGYARIALERFLPDGQVDEGFGLQEIVPVPDGRVTDSIPLFVRLWRSSDGKWTAFATVRERFPSFPTFIDIDYTLVDRFGADGKPDPGFTQNQYLGNADPSRLNTGKLMAFASATVRECKLARLLTDGEPRVDGIMVEYFHEGLRHYFMTLDTFEAAGLDATPFGWFRTGRTFAAWQPVAAPATTPVCRFYGDPVIGPNSHFYTAQDFECQGLVDLDARTPPGVPAWHLEAKPFRTSLPSADGTCPGNLDPVFRVFNGPVDNEHGPNHRYTADPGLYAQMQELGWLPEGVHFCVPPQGPR